MKRSPLGAGKRSLERGSTFKPPRRKKPMTVTERERSEGWARGSRSRLCVVCRAANPAAHHIITRQRLRARATELGVPADVLLWDTRNRLWLCERHHAAHHSRHHPVTWALLEQHAPKVFQFARELGLTAWLERTYPKVNERKP